MSAHSKEEEARSHDWQAKELREQARAERYLEALAGDGYITLVVRTAIPNQVRAPMRIGVGPSSPMPSEVSCPLTFKQYTALKKLVHDLLTARKDGYPR